MTEENTSNPTPTDAQAEESVFGSGDSFFNALDNDVNGIVTDEVEHQGEVQAQQEPEVTQTTQPQADPVSTDGTDWEKRYKDSSREAQRLNSELKELEPVKPLVDFMKRDSGLVDTIRNYLQNGGQTPTSVQNQLNLSEDFVFDGHEAVTDVNSESAKVLNQMVEGTVQKRVNGMLAREKQEIEKRTAKQNQANMVGAQSGIDNQVFAQRQKDLANRRAYQTDSANQLGAFGEDLIAGSGLSTKDIFNKAAGGIGGMLGKLKGLV